MRQSEIERTWVALKKFSPQKVPANLGVKQLVGVVDETAEFLGPINAIVGYNGSGKTALLSCVRGLLEAASGREGESLQVPRIRAADISVSFPGAGPENTIHKGENDTSVVGGPISISLEYVETSFQIPLLQRFSRETQNLEELLAQHEAAPLGADDLNSLSYLVGKTYTAAQVTDLAGEYEQIPSENPSESISPSSIPAAYISTIGDRLPIFKVTSGGATYTSAQMGLGELAIFFIYWKLRTADPSAILLFEEPESFIAPSSQANLMNIIAHWVLKKKMWALISTHSEHMLERLSISSINVLKRNIEGRHHLGPASSADDVLMHLRLDGRRTGTVFVEDWAGFHVFHELISRFRPHIDRTFKILPVFGDGNVLNLVRSYPQHRGSQPIVGILDGDMWNKVPKGTLWPCIALPGKNPPEIELFRALRANPGALAKRLGRTRKSVSELLGVIDGIDHHDIVKELAKRLGLGVQEMTHHLVAVWLLKKENLKTAKKFSKDFDAALKKCVESTN